MNAELRGEMGGFMGMACKQEQQNLLFEMRCGTECRTGVFYMPVTVACQGPAWLRDVVFCNTGTTAKFSKRPVVVSDEDTIMDLTSMLLDQMKDISTVDVLLVWHFATPRDKARFLAEGKWIGGAGAEWARFDLNK